MTETVKTEELKADGTSVTTTEDAAPEADAPLDAQSMAAIRALLAEEEVAPVAPPAPYAAVAAQDAPAADQAAPAEAHTAAPDAKRDRLPPIAAAPAPSKKVQKAAKAPRGPGLLSKLTAPAMARIKDYRPTPKHIILAALALLVLFRPWLVVGIVMLSLLVFVGVFLILGYDGFWQRGMAIARWYAGRNPDRAAQMHARLDNFAMKWDAVLDKFPDGTVDGLYLPDFQEIAAAEQRHEAALDRRLKDMRETEA